MPSIGGKPDTRTVEMLWQDGKTTRQTPRAKAKNRKNTAERKSPDSMPVPRRRPPQATVFTTSQRTDGRFSGGPAPPLRRSQWAETPDERQTASATISSGRAHRHDAPTSGTRTVHRICHGSFAVLRFPTTTRRQNDISGRRHDLQAGCGESLSGPRPGALCDTNRLNSLSGSS